MTDNDAPAEVAGGSGTPDPSDLSGESGAASRRHLSRRGLLFGGVTAGLGAAAGAAAVGAATLAGGGGTATSGSANASASTPVGSDTLPFYGTHQAGVETPAQAHATFLGLDLREGVDRDALRRLMMVLSDDAARLTAGKGALADSEVELAVAPARLTVTFGFGPEFVARATVGNSSLTTPAWLAPLPAFGIDKLEEAWSAGDLLIHVGADDPLTVAHAVRMLSKDSRSFATIRWSQSGFQRARGTVAQGTTARNLFGQVDGTVNPVPGTDDFASVVWIDEPETWLDKGTSLVIRRIHMDLDTWDKADRIGREASVGRTLDTGAPTTGGAEHDEPNFAATTLNGFSVIAPYAHIRRARGVDEEGASIDKSTGVSAGTGERIYRRGYNYDLGAVDGGSVSNAGLIFASYQRDITTQFLPIQKRLDTLDLLNTWTTPIGSSVFAIPPGCASGGYVGETLLG